MVGSRSPCWMRLPSAPRELREFTLVKNDANEPGIGVDRLYSQGQVRRMISTHIGLNPDFIARMNAGRD